MLDIRTNNQDQDIIVLDSYSTTHYVAYNTITHQYNIYHDNKMILSYMSDSDSEAIGYYRICNMQLLIDCYKNLIP